MAEPVRGRRRIGSGPHQVLTAHELRAAGPPLAGPIAGAILYPDEAYCDPKRFVSAVAAQATSSAS